MDSALCTVSQVPGIPTPQAPQSLDDLPSSESESEESSSDEFQVGDSNKPKQFSQAELNDQIRDLGLPKQSAELLGSKLKEKNLLTPGTSFAWYRNREKHFEPYFSEDGELVYCSDINGLMSTFKVQHIVENSRLFIDSSKRSIKAVLFTKGISTHQYPLVIQCI